MNEHQPCRCEIGKNYPGVPHTHSRPSRLVELVDAVGPIDRLDDYTPADWPAIKTREQAAGRYPTAAELAARRPSRTGLAFDTFGLAALLETPAGIIPAREAQARKVDALYRAHLLRAASDRIIRRPRGTTGAYFTSRSGAALDAYAAARTQEIRAEHADNPAAARVAVLIHRARS